MHRKSAALWLAQNPEEESPRGLFVSGCFQRRLSLLVPTSYVLCSGKKRSGADRKGTLAVRQRPGGFSGLCLCPRPPGPGRLSCTMPGVPDWF
jgi:hypothetical protein